MVARDGHVVEEHVRVWPSADARALLLEGEALALAASTCADHESRPVGCDLVQLDRYELACLVNAVGGRHGTAALLARQQRAAALAVVGSLGVDEAALGAVQGHGWLPRSSRGPRRSPAGGARDGIAHVARSGAPVPGPGRGIGLAVGEYVRQALHVLAGDQHIPAVVLAA